MIGIKPQGRLGNVMFQYAFIHALSKKEGKECAIDFYEETDQLPTKKDLKQLGMKILENPVEWGETFRDGFPGRKYEKLYNGYCQREEYFEDAADEIYFMYSGSVERFTIKDTCAVHVRRGDYLAQNNSTYFPVQPESYYREAMGRVNAEYYFFHSDDIEYCRETFSDVKNAIFSNIPVNMPVCDLRMASKHEYVIGSNSTFSWWIAWLSDYAQGNPGKVIMPKDWYGPSNSHLDVHVIVPKRWTLI